MPSIVGFGSDSSSMSRTLCRFNIWMYYSDYSPVMKHWMNVKMNHGKVWFPFWLNTGLQYCRRLLLYSITNEIWKVLFEITNRQNLQSGRKLLFEVEFDLTALLHRHQMPPVVWDPQLLQQAAFWLKSIHHICLGKVRQWISLFLWSSHAIVIVTGRNHGECPVQERSPLLLIFVTDWMTLLLILKSNVMLNLMQIFRGGIYTSLGLVFGAGSIALGLLSSCWATCCCCCVGLFFLLFLKFETNLKKFWS